MKELRPDWRNLISMALKKIPKGDKPLYFAMVIVSKKRLLELGYIDGGGYLYVDSKKVYPEGKV